MTINELRAALDRAIGAGRGELPVIVRTGSGETGRGYGVGGVGRVMTETPTPASERFDMDVGMALEIRGDGPSVNVIGPAPM